MKVKGRRVGRRAAGAAVGGGEGRPVGSGTGGPVGLPSPTVGIGEGRPVGSGTGEAVGSPGATVGVGEGRPVGAALVAQARVAAVSVPLEHEYSVVPASALYPELHATLHVAPLASDSVMTHGELAPPVTPVPSETGSAQ